MRIIVMSDTHRDFFVDDLNSTISSILGDPSKMEQLRQVAQSLGINTGIVNPSCTRLRKVRLERAQQVDIFVALVKGAHNPRDLRDRVEVWRACACVSRIPGVRCGRVSACVLPAAIEKLIASPKVQMLLKGLMGK